MSTAVALTAGRSNGITPEELKKIEAATPAAAAAKPARPRKMLVFSRGKGLSHTAIPYGAKAIELMGLKTGAFTVVQTKDPAAFKADNLKQFDAMCFNNSNRMDFFKDPVLRKNVIDFVKSGKGLVGVHAATTNFSKKWLLDWPEGAEMLGGIFDGHPWHEKVTLKPDDPDHPLCAAFKGKSFEITDEIYQFTGPYTRKKLRILLSLDLNKTRVTPRHKRKMRRKDNDYAVSWIRNYGKGRVFYCSLGHDHPVFWTPAVLKHYLDGIQFALGDLKADATPSDAKPKTDKLTWKKTDETLALLNGDKVVWQFNYDRGKGVKPCFHPVSLLDGTVLTWFRPPDHTWHRAVWFSWKYINRVNYWEEDRKTGLGKGLTEITSTKITPADDHSAKIEMTLSYHPPKKPAVLTEKRLITVSPPDDQGNYRIDWLCSFTACDEDVVLDRTPPAGQKGGKSWGGYAGLSARLAENLTQFKVLNSESKQDAKAHGQKARWTDFSAVTPAGRPAGIAIFDHPSNLRYPTQWYISKKGPKKNNFSSAPLFDKPYTIGAGKTLTLKYRVLVHAGRGDIKPLDAEWKAFTSGGK
jgi:type 1 glutamine amidotransferase